MKRLIKQGRNSTHFISAQLPLTSQNTNKFFFIFFFFFFSFLFLLTSVSAASSQQPTQQYNKIFLNPFYTPSMSINTNYTFNVTVNPPDGISSVKSAIINFDVWMSPTITFQLWVNNKTCNNPSYVISTTFASAGRGVATFDCSNQITGPGVYSITMKPTQQGTGASTAYLDLTYMNNPTGNLKVHGTEYIGGDDGKMFLQFLDANDQPVNNSECFLTVGYPNSTVFFNNSLMAKLGEGIYFYNFLVPNVDGVYPASAKCYRPITFSNLIAYNYTGHNFDDNNWAGGYNWSICYPGDPDCQNGWDYDPALTSIVATGSAGTGGCYGGTGYCAKIQGSYGYMERGFPEVIPTGTIGYNVSWRYKMSGFQTNEKLEIYIWDGNWHLTETVMVTGKSNDVWYQSTHYVDNVEFNLNGALMLGFFAYEMPSGQDIVYIDDVYINLHRANITLSNETDYQVLRGSGEVHVSKLFGNLNYSLSPAQIWNYSNRTLTSYPNITDTINTTKVAGDIWSYPTRNLTYYQDVTNYTKVGESVWTSSATISVGLLNQLAAAIWSYTDRNLTYYPAQVDLTNYTLIANTVWNAASRNLTYYEHIDMTNYTLLELYFNQVPPAVWNYSIRNLTYYQDMTNYTLIGEDITTATNLILNDIDNVPLNVWNYSIRNLTYYQNFGDQTDYDRIILGVWNATDRNLTYYPAQVDLTNDSLIIGETANAVWNATNRNLTYYPQQMDLTN